jgi:3-oxoadipate enol-lactonase
MPIAKLDTVDLYYEFFGEGDPLLLIHGLGSSCQDWELQVDCFARKFRVITVDLRGHGKSDKPPGPYSIALFAEDTARLLEELNCIPAHILGISLGGMVAFQLAISFLEIVKSLIIVNSTPDLIPRTLKDRLGIWQRYVIVQFMGLRKLGEFLGDRFFPDPDQSVLRNIFVERWAENYKPSYMEAMKAVVGWSVLNQLQEIKAPTLVIGADGDYFPTEEKVAYTKVIPGARLEIIKNTRHALPVENPEVFNQTVIDFLAGLPGK